MKKHLLFYFLLTAIGFYTHAQVYKLEVKQQPYDTLMNAEMYSENLPWDDPSDELDPLEFNVPFRMGKESYDFVEIDGGYLVMSDTASTLDQFFVVDGCFMDLCDRGFGSPASLSPIRYTLEGEVGRRILTIEWSNHGYYGEWFHINATEDYGNMKIILDEGMQKVHIHYGPHEVKRKALSLEGYPGYSVYIGEGDDMTFYGSNLAGDPFAPTVHDIELDTFLNAIPADSTMYTFTIGEPLASVNEQQIAGLRIYPNPAKQSIYIAGANQNSRVIIYDARGRAIYDGNCESDGKIDFGDQLPGFYVIRMLDDRGWHSGRFLIKG